MVVVVVVMVNVWTCDETQGWDEKKVIVYAD